MKAALLILALGAASFGHSAVPFEGALPAQLRVQAAFQAGRFAEALAEAKGALNSAQDQLGQGHPSLAPFYEDLAAIQRQQANFRDAEQSYLKALSLRGGDPSRTVTLRHLGALWLDLGNPVLAGEYFKQAGAKAPGKPKPASPDAALHAAALFENLALFEDAAADHKANKKYAQALEIEEKILKVCTAHYGAAHPRTGITMLRISALLSALGRPAESKKFKLEGLKIAETALGSGHPELKRIRLTLK